MNDNQKPLAPTCDAQPGLATAHGSANLETALVVALNALKCYADPESYRAIMIMPDRPAGWFADDIGSHKHPDYKNKMPGVRARRALDKIRALVSPNSQDKLYAKKTSKNRPG